MSYICLSLTGETIKENLAIFESYRRNTDILELRADFLSPGEYSGIKNFPRLAGEVPVILTLRREIDGGRFTGTEQERSNIFTAALTGGAFGYIDLEEDWTDQKIVRLAAQRGTRVIRSFHDFTAVPDNLTSRIHALPANRHEIPKAAVMPHTTSDQVRLFAAMGSFPHRETIILGMGPWGFPSRILSPRFNGFLSYTSARGKEAAPGHIDPDSLSDGYRFREIERTTKIYGIIGDRVMHSLSPAIHNNGFSETGYDGVYLPFQTSSVPAFLDIADLLPVEGFSVTIPYKEGVIPYLDHKSEEVRRIGSCNTVIRGPKGFAGENYDWSGFLDALLGLVPAEALAGKGAAVIGAGGAARAVVFALKKSGMKVLLLNRTAERARRLADEFSCDWEELNEKGIKKINSYSFLIVQTTSVGMAPFEESDPLAGYLFRGDEIVYDLVYTPFKTAFLGRAEKAGCRILNGYEMLLQQAYRQFELFTGMKYPEEAKKRLRSKKGAF